MIHLAHGLFQPPHMEHRRYEKKLSEFGASVAEMSQSVMGGGETLPDTIRMCWNARGESCERWHYFPSRLPQIPTLLEG